MTSFLMGAAMGVKRTFPTETGERTSEEWECEDGINFKLRPPSRHRMISKEEGKGMKQTSTRNEWIA